MKKLIASLIVVALLATAVVALVGCYPDYVDVAEAVAKAQTMTLEELEEASRNEMATYNKDVFTANSLTSGINKALAKFIEKYDWLNEKNAVYVSRKGSDFQPILNAAADTGKGDAGDFVMIQDAAFVYSLYNAGFLHSYVPSGTGFNIAAGDKNPLVGVTFNKIFYHNSAAGTGYLTNVWQLTGEGPNPITKLSYQSPLGEDINMSFLIMLTSPEYESILKSSYQSYFGTAYTDQAGYASIGYYYVAKFINNVSTWHDSDTSEVKNMNDTNHQSGIFFAGLAKVKDYVSERKKEPGAPDTIDWESVIRASGYNYEVEGFNGFVYNMWTLIPDTAHLPYTACLFIRYILSEEGYKAGFNEVGYYSANTLVTSADGSTLQHWKDTCLSENPEYLATNYDTVTAFIKQQLTLAGA